MFGDADELKIRATAKLNGALSPNSNCKIKLTAERRELSGVYTSQVSTLCIGQTTCSLDFNLYKPTDIAKYNYFVDVSATASPECRLDSPFDGTTLLIRKNPKTKVFAFRGNGGFGQGTSPLQIIESVLNKEAFDFEVASYDAIVTGGVEGNPAEDISEFAKTDLMQSSSSDPSCKRYRSIILFGFSNGGHAALDVARKLGMSDVETDMIFLIDPVPWPPSAIESSCRFFIPHPCVRSWINYYQNVDTSIFSFMMTQRGRTLDGGGNNLRDYIEYPGASCSTSEITWPEKAHTLMPCHKSIVDSGVNVIKDAILMKESYSCNPSLARLPDVMTCGG